MKLFLSYAARDRERITSLQHDLEMFGNDVWRDSEIVGGQDWWDRICEQLRGCDAVVFALSPSSTRSRPCEVELQYAAALQRPLLPIMIVDTVLSAAPAPVQTRNVVRYTEPSHEAVVALAAALSTIDPPAVLPTPLPAQPPAPFGDLPDLRRRILVPDQIEEQEQRRLIAALRRVSGGGDEGVFELVRLLRGRNDLYESAARELDELLGMAHESLLPGSEARSLVKALLIQAENGVLTPILGSGLTDPLIGSRRDMARAFAEEFAFPLSRHLREDLPQVAQFVRVTQGSFTLRDRLRSHVAQQLLKSLGEPVVERALELDELLAAAWDNRDRANADPHELMAALPCPVFVTAHPSQLLEHALRAVGKEPVSEVCRWKLDTSDDDWPPAALESPDGMPFRPTVERPLVFHVFGLLAWPTLWL